MPRKPLSPEQLHWLRNTLRSKLSPNSAGKFGSASYDAYKDYAADINADILQLLENRDNLGLGEFRNTKSRELLCTDYLLQRIFYIPQGKKSKELSFNHKSLVTLSLYIFGTVRFDFPEEELVLPGDLQDSLHDGKGSNSNTYEGVKVVKSLSEKLLKEEIGKAKHEIRIIDTFLEYWTLIKNKIKKAAERGVSVQIILLDPNSEMIRLRYKSLSVPPSDQRARFIINEIIKNINDWGLADQIEVRLVDQILSMNVFSFDDKFYLGYFWMGLPASQGATLEVQKKGILYESVFGHFQRLWDNGRNVNSTIVPAIGVREKDRAQKLRKYVGTWLLYCNYRERNQETFKIHSMSAGKVARNILVVEEVENKFLATFSADYLPAYTGTMEIAENPSFVNFKLFDEDGGGYLLFTVHIGSGLQDYLTGIFLNQYPSHPILGTGIIVMEKSKEKNPAPILIDTYDPPPDLSPSSSQIIRYLAYSLGARLEPMKDKKDFERFLKFSLRKDCPYKGLYFVYTYHRSNHSREVYISKTVLEITPFYSVRIKRPGNTYPVSYGVIEYMMGRRQFLISMQDPGSKKAGFFMFTAKEGESGSEELIGGMFLGLANTNIGAWSVAKRMIMEPIDQEGTSFDSLEAERFELFSKEYYQLQKGIRQNLTGRVNNFLGFVREKTVFNEKGLQREKEKEINFGEVFFESACQKALDEEIGDSAEMLLRAVRHGYKDLPAFMDKLKDFEEKGILPSYFIAQIQRQKDYRMAKAIVEKYPGAEPTK